MKKRNGCQKSLQREMKRFKREFDEVYENNSLVDCCHPAFHLLMCLQYSKFDKNNMRTSLPYVNGKKSLEFDANVIHN